LKTLSSFKYPVWYLILNYMTMFLSIFLYALLYGVENLNEMSLEVPTFFTIAVNILFLIVLMKKYPKETQPIEKTYIDMLMMGFCYSIFCNVLFLPYTKTAEVSQSLLFFLTSVILGPIIEEYVFRGFLFRELGKQYSFAIATTISSCSFAILHPSLTQMFFAFFLGLFTSYTYMKTGHLKNAIYFHIAANFVGFTCQEILSYAPTIVWLFLSIIPFFFFLFQKKETL